MLPSLDFRNYMKSLIAHNLTFPRGENFMSGNCTSKRSKAKIYQQQNYNKEYKTSL